MIRRIAWVVAIFTAFTVVSLVILVGWWQAEDECAAQGGVPVHGGRCVEPAAP